MAEIKDSQVVVEVVSINTISAMQHHPLMEISHSPGHLLLLKLWQREEYLYGRSIAFKETRLDIIKREVFQLCCLFFMFHALFLIILFTSSSQDGYGDEHHNAREKRWIPSVLSICPSVVIVFLVQMKLFRYWKVSRQLHKERGDNRAVMRCIQELRMKGGSFDLSKEPQNGRRMKSSRVEAYYLAFAVFSDHLSCFLHWSAISSDHVHVSCLILSVFINTLVDACQNYPKAAQSEESARDADS